MAEKPRQIEEPTESKIEFGDINEQNIDEVARLVSEIHTAQPQRTQLTPEQAKEEWLKKDLEETNAITVAMLENGEIVGYSWMYEIFKDDLGEGKDKKSLELATLFEGSKRVFYASDIGLSDKLRGRGLGRKLVQENMDRVKKGGGNVVVLSTYPKEGYSAYELYKKIGFAPIPKQQPKESKRYYMVYEFKEENKN